MKENLNNFKIEYLKIENKWKTMFVELRCTKLLYVYLAKNKAQF